MSFVFPMEEMFDAFGEPAYMPGFADPNITVIPNFNIEIETDQGFQSATGYTGIFSVSQDIYDFCKSSETQFTYGGKTFRVVQKKPVDAGVYEVVAEA